MDSEACRSMSSGFRERLTGQLTMALISGLTFLRADMIRTIWAYLYGLLEVSRTHSTNHAGLLILDEPQQQETAAVSFKEFLNRAAGARAANQQVVFATSEDSTNLDRCCKRFRTSTSSLRGKPSRRWNSNQYEREHVNSTWWSTTTQVRMPLNVSFRSIIRSSIRRPTDIKRIQRREFELRTV